MGVGNRIQDDNIEREDMNTPLTRLIRTTSPSMTRMLKALEGTRLNIDQWAKASLVARMTAENYVKQLRFQKLIYICEYQRNRSGWPKPVYALGDHKDAPRLEKKDQLARAREWKETSGWYESEKAKRRLARPRDPVLAALMGI